MGGTMTSFIVFLCGSTITGNTVAWLQNGSGTVSSLGNNIIRGNAGNQVPTTTNRNAIVATPLFISATAALERLKPDSGRG